MVDMDRELAWLRQMSQVHPRDAFGFITQPRPYIDASDDLIASMGDEVFNQHVQSEAYEHVDGYHHENYCWDAERPAEICGTCYRWGRYPPGKRQFGYVGWQMCQTNCPCAHHATEIWLA